MAWSGPYKTKGSIIARLVDRRGREVRRMKVPGSCTFLLSLKDGKYYDRRAWSKTFVVRLPSEMRAAVESDRVV